MFYKIIKLKIILNKIITPEANQGISVVYFVIEVIVVEFKIRVYRGWTACWRINASIWQLFWDFWKSRVFWKARHICRSFSESKYKLKHYKNKNMLIFKTSHLCSLFWWFRRLGGYLNQLNHVCQMSVY